MGKPGREREWSGAKRACGSEGRPPDRSRSRWTRTTEVVECGGVAALLDNVIWHALVGSQRACSVGTERVRRYAPGFSPLLGFADPARPDFAGLAPFCGPEESLLCSDWTGPMPAGWRLEEEATLYRMIWAGTPPTASGGPEAVRLGPEHALPALELAQLTQPGPFGPRTIELGEYFGEFEDGCLVAMAGERLQAGSFREISGVCTDPRYRGRGLARRLVTALIARQWARGQTPFLHVRRDNFAVQFYERLGFRRHSEPVVRVVARLRE